MPSHEWSSTRRILVAWDGTDSVVDALAHTLRTLEQAVSQATRDLFVLSASVPASQLAAIYAPLVREILISPAPWYAADSVCETISLLLRYGFDAAFICAGEGQSPYPLAYICYLAGIPVRVGFSAEFGGGLLSAWLKPPPVSMNAEQRYLALLEAAGLTNDALERGA